MGAITHVPIDRTCLLWSPANPGTLYKPLAYYIKSRTLLILPTFFTGDNYAPYRLTGTVWNRLMDNGSPRWCVAKFCRMSCVALNQLVGRQIQRNTLNTRDGFRTLDVNSYTSTVSAVQCTYTVQGDGSLDPYNKPGIYFVDAGTGDVLKRDVEYLFSDDYYQDDGCPIGMTLNEEVSKDYMIADLADPENRKGIWAYDAEI